jgi:hypothetical protein
VSKKEQKILLPALDSWLHSFLNGYDLYSISRRIYDIIILCGRKFVTKEVPGILNNVPTKTEDISFVDLSNSMC